MADLARASVEITDGSFDAEVMRSPLPILVEFWAPWFKPCRDMAPVMAKVQRGVRRAGQAGTGPGPPLISSG
jgi:thioredoxin-like negative regulator of GroEL